MIPIKDRVIIKQEEKKDKVGSVLLPESGKVESLRGKIVAVGPQVKDVRVGDFVLFNVNYNQKIYNEGQEYITINETDVLAILDRDSEVSPLSVVEGVGVQVNGASYG